MTSNDKLCYVSQRVICALNAFSFTAQKNRQASLIRAHCEVKIVMCKRDKREKKLGKNTDEVDVLSCIWTSNHTLWTLGSEMYLEYQHCLIKF